MGKTLNFDLFMQEKQRKTMQVTVFGDVYEIPMEIPAIVPVMMARAEESMDSAETTRMVMRAADNLFGKENVDRMCSKGLSAMNLANLVEKVFSAINGTDEDEAQELDDESGKKQTGSRAKK